MSDINLSHLENAVYLMIAVAVLVGAVFLWLVWRWIRKRRGNGRKG
ncbi:MAG TPA: hypothetical protein VJL84_03055 [Kiloniellales bacterium]|nr:hypothetical protein [Kiloniellales bacterium]